MTTVYTIGHSTRDIGEFIELLKTQKITRLADIRTIPRSRHNPQYEQAALKQSLAGEGIEYVYMKELGGLRPSTKDSPNMAWRNKSFRNYADYMQTVAFADGVDRLINLAREKTTAIMCAEAVPWRCHRSLVGDALLVRDVAVKDIISPTSINFHELTTFAVVNGTQITYPDK
jgi:uncharacterized protein (DUF488 family)